MEEKLLTPSKSSPSRFFYGYVIVFVAFSLQVFGWGIANSFSVFFKSFDNDFGWSRAVVSSPVSFSLLVAGLAGIVQGRLNDRFGPKMLMTGGGILLAAGYLLMPRMTTLWEYYLYVTVIIGIGISGTDIVLLSTTARWFIKKRSTMSGIIKVGTGVGMLIMPIFITRLITGDGWRNAFLVLGLLILIVYVALSQWLVRDPAKIGLSPDGSRNEDALERRSFEAGLAIKEAVRTHQWWMICVSYSFVMFCVSIVLFHIVPHAMDLGISAVNAANVLATIGAFSIAGRLVMGAAADKIGTKSGLVICFLCLFSGLIWLQFCDRLWMFFLFAVIHGFAHGGFFTINSPLLADFFGTRSHGVIFGVVVSISTIGGAVGPVVAGYMFDVTGSYRAIFVVLIGMSIAGLIATALLKPVLTDS